MEEDARIRRKWRSRKIFASCYHLIIYRILLKLKLKIKYVKNVVTDLDVPTKDETVKTTWDSKIYDLVKLSYHEVIWKFRTVDSEVLFFVDNPVYWTLRHFVSLL